VRVIIGEAEHERLTKHEIDLIAAGTQVINPSSLLDLYHHISRARVYIGNDTGPTHLAAMLGVPTHAYFGPASDATVWAPIGPHVQIRPFLPAIAHE
jgi:ADP-heptose:LPS heptosyltransferase